MNALTDADEQQLQKTLTQVQQRVAAGDELQALAAALKMEHGNSVLAILYYGSCLRSGRADEGIADFYVLVDSYRQAGMKPIIAILNRLLPPNVYYLETSFQGKTLRAKYAVIRIDQFKKGVTGGWFLPYLWGRFAQPSGMLWTKDEATYNNIMSWLIQSLSYFIEQGTALMADTFTSKQLWETSLRNSYQTELRAERNERIAGLFDFWPDYYVAQTQLILTTKGYATTIDTEIGEELLYRSLLDIKQQRQGRRRWWLRKIVGKLTALLKLVKSLLTFNGAMDYAAWKIERHSGQKVELPNYARRWPLIGGWIILMRLLRRGSLR